MHPWLFHYPPISSYGVCIVVALLAGWLWARSRAKVLGIDPSKIDLLMPVLTGAGLLGAVLFGRLTDVLTEEAAHGAVLIGSLLVATAAGIAYALLARIPLGILGDICAAPLALGIGVGRLGCFFAGCCYGKVCAPALGIHFPRDSFVWLDQLRHGQIAADALYSLPVYPTQLYESALCLLLAALLWKLLAGPRVAGEQFLAMGIGYAAVRFAVEFLRADNPPVLEIAGTRFTFSQLAAIVILVLALTTGWTRRRFASRWGLLQCRSPGRPVRTRPALASMPQHPGEDENQDRSAQATAQ